MRIYSHFAGEHLINQFLIVNDETMEALMIDASDLDGRIIDIIEKNKIRLNALRTITIKDGDVIREAELDIECFHVPGHSLDSICYKIGSALFTGDTLQSGYISQTNALIEKELLINGIKEKLLTLDDNTLVFPGHGPISKIRVEKMFNQDILEANRLLNL